MAEFVEKLVLVSSYIETWLKVSGFQLHLVRKPQRLIIFLLRNHV